MRVLGLLQERDRRAREHEGAANVHVLHEVVLLLGQVERTGKVDDARVVHDDVDAAELGSGRLDGTRNVGIFAHVAVNRQRPAAGLANGRRRGVNGALKLRVRRVRLRKNRNVCPVGRCAKRDREADAAAAAAHEDGLSCQ